MSYRQIVPPANAFEYLLEEVIAKACLKGARIHYWYRSPNGRIVVEVYGKLPVFYLSINAAIDTLIHQYNLISQYRHLYQSTSQQRFKHFEMEETEQERKMSVSSKAIYECDTIFSNMDNELTASTKRKLYETLEKINASERMNPAEFYHFQNTLLEYFRNKVIEARSTKKKKQLQIFLHFLEELSYSDIE